MATDGIGNVGIKRQNELLGLELAMKGVWNLARKIKVLFGLMKLLTYLGGLSALRRQVDPILQGGRLPYNMC